MISKRYAILRLCIFFNVVVLLYVAIRLGGIGEDDATDTANTPSGRILASIDSDGEEPLPTSPAALKSPNPNGSSTSKEPPVPPSAPNPSPPETPTLAQMVGCFDKRPSPRYRQRGDHWVLMDYVFPTKTFPCADSVTYTTHGDFTFLDNLAPLVERWRGPVSVALFAPGEDFAFTLSAISYARSCLTPLVHELVSFHLYFGVKEIPSVVPKPSDKDSLPEYDCEGKVSPPPWGNGNRSTPYVSYRSRKSLVYPVNVGRNIAREAATTHYVLPSDIELYPSPGVIGSFLDFMRKEKQTEMSAFGRLLPAHSSALRVYVLPIFEIAANMSQPQNKAELVKMLKNGSAIPFHKNLCPWCHTVPKAKKWQEESLEEGEMKVFHVGKRIGAFSRWEPIFIGTDNDPPYDERLSWEGMRDKMTQGYALCTLDYEFRILNRAFLVHRPGIKTYKNDPKRLALSAKTNTLIKNVITPELKVLYGTRKGCVV